MHGVQLFSAVDATWMPVPSIERPCVAAMWDARHPHTFALHDGAALSLFALNTVTLTGPGMCAQTWTPSTSQMMLPRANNINVGV